MLLIIRGEEVLCADCWRRRDADQPTQHRSTLDCTEWAQIQAEANTRRMVHDAHTIQDSVGTEA